MQTVCKWTAVTFWQKHRVCVCVSTHGLAETSVHTDVNLQSLTKSSSTAPQDCNWSCAALKSSKMFLLSWQCSFPCDFFPETLSWLWHHAPADQSVCIANYNDDMVLFWSVADGFHPGLFCLSCLISRHLLACIFLHPVSQKHLKSTAEILSLLLITSITGHRFTVSQLKQQFWL